MVLRPIHNSGYSLNKEVSAGQSYQYNLDSVENVVDISLNVIGVENTQAESVSSDKTGGTIDITVGGTTNARNGSITLTGKTVSQNVSSSGSISDTNSDNISIGGDESTTFNVTISPDTQSGYESFSQYDRDVPIDVSGTDYITELIVYAIDSNAVRESTEIWSQSGRSGTKYSSGDSFPQSHTNFDVSDQDTIWLYSTDDYDNYNDLSWDGATPIESPNISFGGNSKSYSTITSPTDMNFFASPGSNTFSINTSTGGYIDYDASWTEVTNTKDPSVTINGQTVSYTGTLSDGVTTSGSINLNNTSYTADVSVNGTVGVEIAWDEVFETVDPTVEINGNSTSHTGTIADGDVVEVSADSESLTTGTNTIGIPSSQTNFIIDYKQYSKSIWKDIDQ